MDQAVTPPSIDVGVRGDDALRLVAGREGAPEATIRFADLLAREDAVAPAGAGPTLSPQPVRSLADPARETAEPSGPSTAPAAHARLFNQDGFFGRPNAVVPAADAPPCPIPDAPVAAVATTVAAADAVAASAMPAPPVQASAAPPAAAFRGATTRERAAVTASSHPRVPTPVAGPARAALRPSDAIGPRTRPAAAQPGSPRLSQPAASVAVAVHAAARGIEVAAQVAGLDERDRAALADEIAALLFAHGYPPGQVSVIAAAARGSRQDHR